MSFADGLSTDLFSTSSAMSAPLLSVFNSTRSKNPYVPGEIPPGENINRLEVENAHQVMSEQNKKVQSFDSKWMHMFHMSIIEGDWAKFNKCIHVIYHVLYAHRTPSLKRMNEAEFKNYVMMGIVHHFYDANENTTILMSIAATRDLTRTCEEVDHGYCKMISTILSHLTPVDINVLLQITTKRTGRTAIHFAATTGQICQLQALLRYDINPDIIDKSGLAPIHHAIERNNLEMVKLLIRYGADPSLCPRDRFKHPPRILAMANAQTQLASWLQIRLDAINREFQKSVNQCIGKYWQIVDNLSDVHFLRASENYNYQNLHLSPITR
uniref:Uncharacterized protein n=1 Tax=Acrobeloides nanus TaxID=290746 RepID=A0A914D7M2_9BILA